MLLIFESTHSVIKAEKKCRMAEIDCKVIPVPRSISSQCGMALEISENLKGQVLELMAKNSIKATIAVL